MPGWRKWKPTDPTSPHWYTHDQLRALIAAYLTDERGGSGEAAAAKPPPIPGRRTVREFVSEFDGLRGSAKQKAVTEATGTGRATLQDMLTADGQDVDLGKVSALLEAMQHNTRPVKPAALGVIGEAHIRQYLAEHCGVHAESIRYKKIEGEDSGLPFVLETGFGLYTDEDRPHRQLVGLNWSPALKPPMNKLGAVLGANRVDPFDPVVIVVHLASPHLKYTDRGKGRWRYDKHGGQYRQEH